MYVSVAQSCPTLGSPMDYSQTPLSIALSRQEYWRGLPFPSPRDVLHPGTELESLASAALADRFSTASAIWADSDQSYPEHPFDFAFLWPNLCLWLFMMYALWIKIFWYNVSIADFCQNRKKCNFYELIINILCSRN